MADARVIGWFVVCLAAMVSAAESVETFRVKTRGFGDVEVTARFSGEGAGRTSWTTFLAEDEAHARICASKRLADLGFGDLKPVADSGLAGTVLELPGAGVWLLGVEGNRFHELFAPSRKALARQAKASGAAAWQAVPARAYPRWLDCFDNAGPGVWGGRWRGPVRAAVRFRMAARPQAHDVHAFADRVAAGWAGRVGHHRVRLAYDHGSQV
jgi:hypothetical protein